MEEIKKVCKALSSETRLKIIELISQKKYTAVGLYKEYNNVYSDAKQRETIYRELEKLVEAGILEKDYNKDTKNIEYGLGISKLTIDLIKLKLDHKLFN